MEDIIIPPSRGKIYADMMEKEREIQELRHQFEEEHNKKHKSKIRAIIMVALIVAAILGFLAVLNGRYVAIDNKGVFDQWKGEYVKIVGHIR